MMLRFEAMFYSNLGNKKSGADHIKCSRGRRFPTPGIIQYTEWSKKMYPFYCRSHFTL